VSLSTISRAKNVRRGAGRGLKRVDRVDRRREAANFESDAMCQRRVVRNVSVVRDVLCERVLIGSVTVVDELTFGGSFGGRLIHRLRAWTDRTWILGPAGVGTPVAR
jgi:hypothetical protein